MIVICGKGLELNFTLLKCTILIVKEDAGLFLWITVEKERLCLICTRFRSAQEVHKIKKRDLSQESPGEHLVVLLLKLFFNTLIRVLVTQDRVQVIAECWCVTWF